MLRSLPAAVRCSLLTILAVLTALSAATTAHAAVEVYRDGAKYVALGARIQLQYNTFEPDGGESVDEVIFRRLRPEIRGGVTDQWEGKIQVDFGGATDGGEVAIKDAYFRYTGDDRFHFTVGNQKPPFSHEFLVSSNEQQLVERTFVGDHNYGSPDRFAGFVVNGTVAGDRLAWFAGFGSASHDPDARRMDFDTPVNRNADFNEGWLAAGRLELHPLGEFDLTEADFDRGPWRVLLAGAAFTWSNDGDNDTYTNDAGLAVHPGRADLDEATGLELTAAVAGAGLSADVQYQLIEGDTVDPRFTGGIYVDGTSELEQLVLEGGYMVVAQRLELVGAWESQDADGYDDTWTRTSVGVNYYFNRHKLKGQLTYRMGENLDGVVGNDADELFLQLHYAF